MSFAKIEVWVWLASFIAVLTTISGVTNADELKGSNRQPIVMDLWPNSPPGPEVDLPPEADFTKPDDKLIAGRRIIKLGNVTTPQLAVYRPDEDVANGTAVVICPGGGHYILAYDLEGTEIAEWFTSIGVTAIVLKYRVPSRDKDQRWMAAVQDAQRAMSIVRSKSKEWNLNPERIGICGFSAGGETAALTSVFWRERKYESIDSVDATSSRPDFAMLIYPGGLIQKSNERLREYIKVDSETPPMFFAHAFDDNASVHNSLSMATALRLADVSAEVHVYATGGHGYGLRKTDQPVTEWPQHAERWMRVMQLIPDTK